MAKLKSQWWKKQLPKNYSSKLVGPLKEFEKAVKTNNVTDIRDEILGLKNAIGEEYAELMKATGAKSPKSPKFVGYKKSLAELQRLVDREDSSLQKNGARNIKVWSKDFCKEVARSANQKFLNLAGGQIDVTLNLSTIHAIENAGLQSRFFRALDDAFKAEAGTLADDILAAVAKSQLPGLALTKLQVLHFQNLTQKRISRTRQRLQKVSETTIDKAIEYHKHAKEFKKQRAIEVTTAALTVVGSAAAVAMPGTLPLAVVSLARSVAKLTEEIYSTCLTLEKHYVRVKNGAELLGKSFAKGKREAKEIAKISANALIGAGVFKTYEVLKTNHDHFKGTLAVVADRIGRQQRGVLELMKKLGILSAKLDAMVVDAAKFKRSALKMKITRLQTSLDKLLDKASDTMNRVVSGEANVRKLDSEITKLGDSSLSVKIAEVVIPACVDLAFSVGGFGDGVAASKEAANVAANTVGMASDIEGFIIDMTSGIKGAKA